jgi:predicted RNA-binding protein YlqC (UPF0109 family)
VEEFVEFVIRRLIEFPDEMVLTKIESPRKVVFQIQLRQSDIGFVIGKQGHTIEAIRNLLNAAASRHGQKVVLQILEEKGGIAPPQVPVEG